ncbi:DUF3306 domain-containing protein [Rhodobacteraceae bacterium CCMM004]|nr:DUF3306 domain-containing protein [Rhodobacteraceae bacterium CCMM004]
MNGGDFWSRRRARVAAETEADTVAAEEAEVAAERQALAERPDSEILAALDLPDPDTLERGDDITGFMARAVPERLRRRALRRLWRLDPRLANLDGMVDYGEDFTDAGLGAGVVETTYQVGKGMLRHVEEMARKAAAEAEAAEAEDRALDAPAETPRAEDAPAEDPAPAAADAPEDAALALAPSSAAEAAGPPARPEPDADTAPPRRRMRFVHAT